MAVHAAHVQAAVQQLLMEHGEYAPLEFLLVTNRLGYDDYRAWREGRLETLDGEFADGKRETCAWLEAAQSWACALDLVAEPAVHHGWEENAGTVLVASVDLALNALLNTRFRQTRGHEQLDLFIDSAQTVAVNALVDALMNRDAAEARGALEALDRIDRDHGQRHHASKLIAALETPAPEGPERGVDRLGRMEREWVPAGSALLGARRRDFLAPLWRDIGQALDPAPFDRGHPERHASRAYREGLDWERTRQSVLAVPGYNAEPVLLVRLAEAHWRRRDRVKAIDSWFTLCRVAPEAFEQLIEASDFPDWSLHRAWRVAQEQAVEHELTPAWLPAWMLLEETGLASVLATCPAGDEPSRAFNLVIALLSHRGLDERGIELRRSLQAIHPGLLERFLAKQARASAARPFIG